jgi:[ribosomal protein S18]-alanine N-acetyltransferase
VVALPRRLLAVDSPVREVVVVPMRPRHLPAVLAIERRCYPRPWTAALFSDELRRDDRGYLVALGGGDGPGWLGGRGVPGWLGGRGGQRLGPGDGPRWRLAGTVVGYAGVIVQVGEAHITTVAVRPDLHRRKIATRLLIALLREARRRGAEAATLEVRAANAGAQRLYAQFGFGPVGIRPGYYAETGEDALIMWLHDLQGDAVAACLADQARRLGEPGGASGAPDLPVPWVTGRVGLRPSDEPSDEPSGEPSGEEER